MSKNVKSNNKNTKKSASKSKKSTRNIYKMDAEPLDSALEPNLDIEQFDKIDFTQFHLADKANAAVVNIFLQFNTDPLFVKADGTN